MLVIHWNLWFYKLPEQMWYVICSVFLHSLEKVANLFELDCTFKKKCVIEKEGVSFVLFLFKSQDTLNIMRLLCWWV